MLEKIFQVVKVVNIKNLVSEEIFLVGKTILKV